MSLHRFDRSESELENYNIIESGLTLKDMKCSAHKKGDTILKVNSRMFCKGTKFLHVQDNSEKYL